jgi:hypothetical protein
MFEWEGERVSNIGIFESVSQPRYKEEEDISEGIKMLEENSKYGLCPHQHFQENRFAISIIDDSQDSLISMGMVRVW